MNTLCHVQNRTAPRTVTAAHTPLNYTELLVSSLYNTDDQRTTCSTPHPNRAGVFPNGVFVYTIHNYFVLHCKELSYTLLKYCPRQGIEPWSNRSRVRLYSAILLWSLLHLTWLHYSVFTGKMPTSRNRTGNKPFVGSSLVSNAFVQFTQHVLTVQGLSRPYISELYYYFIFFISNLP